MQASNGGWVRETLVPTQGKRWPEYVYFYFIFIFIFLGGESNHKSPGSKDQMHAGICLDDTAHLADIELAPAVFSC